ncbi:Aspartyl protease family protein [Thalictrum thalictroides]|uniref:Aspartyl protease family protein n=1 Tax=Thalictrum thalictroides TaxID=46969 RepID=A0A7J6WYB8_THATH|nr:Aspartyl protease family protein [Thalictrum thalictroides]
MAVALNTFVVSNVYYYFLVLLLLLQLVVAKSNNGFTLKLIHRDSIESPLYPGNLTLEERAARLHHQTDARVNYYATKIAAHTASAKLLANQSENLVQPEVIRPRISFQSSFYLAKVGFGSFDNLPVTRNYRNYNLMVDTGSELIWTQCEPCDGCFQQVQPLFPLTRLKSRTYNMLKCNNHRLCYPNKCFGDYCSFGIQYSTRQNSSGFIGYDKFTFEVDNGTNDYLYPVVFGCATIQRNFNFSARPNQINGILGMALGPRSFVNQLGTRAQGRFSYCIPYATDSSHNIYLRFGQEARFRAGQQVSTIPIVAGGGVLQAYYVNLLDISVGRIQLNFTPGYFSLKPDRRNGGCLIDSGSPLTALPPLAYNRVKDAVAAELARSHLQIIQKPGYDLCFQRPTSRQQPPPVIRFHFQGAVFTLRQGAYLNLSDAICLAFKSSGGLGGVSVIIGGIAQSDYRFVFDAGAKTVAFAREDCTAETR